MTYRINEFQFDLPDASVQDTSINILRFDALGTSLVVSRSLLAEGETLQSNFEEQLAKLEKQLAELNKYEEIVHHYADMRLPLDLDDGVKVNYGKLADMLTKIK